MTRRLVICLALGAAGFAACSDDDAGPAGSGETTIDGIETFEVESRDHVDTRVEYEQTPPVGGPHHPVWTDCGFYQEELPVEEAVHSLEHGAVWITYGADLAEDQRRALAAMIEGQTHVLVSLFPGLASPVVASAWGVQLRLDGVDDPRLAQFVEEYQQGPQTPEPGAPCSGGSGGMRR